MELYVWRARLLVFASLSLQTACVWHGRTIDYFWGPSVFEVSADPTSRAFLVKQLSFPILLEGGNRWGITLGYFDRLIGLPFQTLNSSSSHNSSQQPLRLHPVAAVTIGSLEIAPFYAYLERDREPEFVVRKLLGLQLTSGSDKNGSNFTIGTMHQTTFLPRQDALYLLEFSYNRPLEMYFIVCEAEKNESFDNCLQEILP
jgi:hypothetical protein